ncbi:hypothetical protein C8R42DRAFT_721674 [Lentinula raphanica]|nr:hypothetical protein C8R42DRAFT_721674 [Lentinula raphanica]
MSSMQKRYVVLHITGGGIFTSMQWRRSGGNAPPLPICIQLNSNSQARIVYNTLQPFVLQYGNIPPSQFIDAITNSHEVTTTELALLQDEGLSQGTRIWWHARYATHAGIYSSMRELVNAVDNSNPNFRHAFGFGAFSEALYSALTFDSNPPGLLYDYNPSNQTAANDIRRSLFPHGIMPVALPLPITIPAPPYTPRASTPPQDDSTNVGITATAPIAATSSTAATSSAAATASTAAIPSTSAAPNPTSTVNNPPVGATATPNVVPAMFRASSASPRPRTPEHTYGNLAQVYEYLSPRSPPPASTGGGLVIYSPSVNISYGDTPSKPSKTKAKSKVASKSKEEGSTGKGKAKALSSDDSDGGESTFTGIGGLLWVRHYFECQNWEVSAIHRVERMLSTAEDCAEFVANIMEVHSDVMEEGVARFIYDLYQGTFNT